MAQNELSIIFLAVLLFGLAFILQWVWRRPASKSEALDMTAGVGECEVTSRLLMTSEEASLFNLIRLATQDYFFVFIKLPVLQVVSVADQDEAARKALIRAIRSVRLDVVLAHPGSLQTVTVVHFQKEESQQLEERDQVVATVLKAAGINVVVLQLNQTYSVEQLIALFGLADDE